MGLGKILLIGGAVAGVTYLFVKHSQASSGGTVALQHTISPPIPPPGAATMSVPPGPKNPTGLTLTITQWQQPDSVTQKTTLVALVQNAANPQQDFVATASNGTSAGIVQQGTTANSGLIAQAFVAGLLS